MDLKGNVRRLFGGAVPVLALREPEKSQKNIRCSQAKIQSCTADSYESVLYKICTEELK
jgi:hypothetical protein